LEVVVKGQSSQRLAGDTLVDGRLFWSAVTKVIQLLDESGHFLFEMLKLTEQLRLALTGRVRK